MTGLYLQRNQHNSMVWWNVIHTSSGLPVDTAVTQFKRKRDAQRAMNLLLDTNVDWTLATRKAMEASNPAGAAQVAAILRGMPRDQYI